ncbi:MAG: hypothetical protein M3R02_27305, partial [Chloroflexota bacterium]|nr:hypothetical protein [Chloroflexota bacterium]
MQFLLAHKHPSPLGLDLERTSVQCDRGTSPWTCPPTHGRTDARKQLPESKRFDHVVVGAQLQPVDFVLLLTASGEQQNRDIRRGAKL